MTNKQRIAAKKMVENGGNISSAMRIAGYSDSMIKNPQKVTKSKGFKEILENIGLDDKSLAKALKEGLEANKVIIISKNKNPTYISKPDYGIRHRYLETALELKGYVGRNSKPQIEGAEVVFINNMPRPSYQTLIAEQRKQYGI